MRTMLPSPEQLVDMAGHAAAVKLAMDGAFDDKIAALKDEQAKLAEQLGMVKTVADAARILTDAQAEAEKSRMTIADAMTKAGDAVSQAGAKLSAVVARETAVAAREAQVDSRSAQLDARETAIADAQTTKDQELTQREGMIAKNLATLQAGQKKLSDDVRSFNQKLDAYKALQT